MLKRLRNDNVLVQIQRLPERTHTDLLFLPQNRRVKPIEVLQARVVLVGPGRPIDKGPRTGERVPCGVSMGDLVIVEAPSAQDWSLDRLAGRAVPRNNAQQTEDGVAGVGYTTEDAEEFRIVRADEILAVVEASDV